MDDVVKFAGEHGWPVVLKASSGGYDGRGVWMLDTAQQARETVPELLEAGTPLLDRTARTGQHVRYPKDISTNENKGEGR